MNTIISTRHVGTFLAATMVAGCSMESPTDGDTAARVEVILSRVKELLPGPDALLASTGANAAGKCTIPSYVAAQRAPLGWASLGGGTTGGGSAKPIVVTTLAQLNAAAKGASPAVIHVLGNLGKGTALIGSNKTVIGCSGNATLNGNVAIKGSKNVILRNLNIVGYNCASPDVNVSSGGQCQDGQDAVNIDKKSRNIWLDHDSISDGSDGNLDITHGSDFITISYTKFSYSRPRTDPHDTGAKGHRFSTLVGGSDSNGSEDTGHLNVTWHHNWWGQYVVQRQPRVRFGKNHLFNNLWTSTDDDYCIGVGVGASVLSENNVFSEAKKPIDTGFINPGVAKSSVKSSGDQASGGTPTNLNPGSVFKPGYKYTLKGTKAVAADVKANAGPK